MPRRPLDSDRLREIGQEVGASIAALETEIHGLAGGPFNIGSPKQLAEVLFGKLALPVIRTTKTGPSTDADVLEELAALHPVPAKIVEYRALTKLKGTYIDALPALVNPAPAGCTPPSTRRWPRPAGCRRATRTCRTSRSAPRSAAASARRSSPSRGTCWCRPTIRRSSCASWRTFRRIRRSSTRSAPARTSTSARRPRCSACRRRRSTPEQRRIAKAINFGLVFGQTDFGLAQVLRIPRAQAQARTSTATSRATPACGRTWTGPSPRRARPARSTTLLGRRRPLPEIRSTRAQDRAYAERIARNTPIQGSAADLLKLAMIRVDRAIEAGQRPARDAALLLTVHDELVFEVPPEARRQTSSNG